MKLENCVVGTKVKIKSYEVQTKGGYLRSWQSNAGGTATIRQAPDSDGDVRVFVDGVRGDFVHHSNLKLIKGSK